MAQVALLPKVALFVISLRCNDLSAFGTKRTRHERQRIAGVPFSPHCDPRPPTAPKRFMDSFFGSSCRGGSDAILRTAATMAPLLPLLPRRQSIEQVSVNFSL